ncbi:MAG: CAP domain-containing protein [Candidatus Saccharimonadales bacterium]|jgi:hypothetical protein
MVLVAKPKRTPTIHHKKRSGLHHKQSKHYAKPYWPYLPLIAIVGIGILINSAWSHQIHGVLGYSTNVSSTQLLADTNTQRELNDDSSLALNSQLTQAAQTKANDMATRNYWSHNSPDGRTPWSFISASGYQFAAAGENLAYGFNSSNDIMNGWMNSPEHRTNVLNKVFTQIGFGIANAPNYQGHGPETVVVAMYGEPASLVSTDNAPVSAPSSMPAVVVSAPKATNVSRMQAVSVQEPWAIFLVSVVTALAIVWFILRHGLILRRAFVKSEAFVIRHPFFDVVVIVVATFGVLLTRTAGFIH